MTNKNNKISIIIPVYNVERYIERCLDSVLSSTYNNIEVICVNDGSPDNCENIIKEYQNKDRRVILISQENQGLSAARNTGIAHSSGEYITFIDSDDWIHSQYIEILISRMKQDNSDVVICGFKQTKCSEVPHPIYYQQDEIDNSWQVSIKQLFEEKKYKMHRVYSCGVLYKKEQLLYLFPEGIKVIEDNIFNLINMTSFQTATIVNLPLYYYYINCNSIMHSFSVDDAYAGLDWLIEFMQTTNIDKFTKDEIILFIYKRALYYRYLFSIKGKKKEASKKTKQILLKLEKVCNINDYINKTIYFILANNAFLYWCYKKIRSIYKNEFVEPGNKIIYNKEEMEKDDK